MKQKAKMKKEIYLTSKKNKTGFKLDLISTTIGLN